MKIELRACKQNEKEKLKMARELQRAAKSGKMEDCSVLGNSPSFSSYTSTRLAEIAAKVGGEIGDGRERFGLEGSVGKVIQCTHGEQRQEEKSEKSDPRLNDGQKQLSVEKDVEGESDATTDDDFEFSCVCSHHEALTISADEIFANGQIRPIYPIFDRDLVSGEFNKDFIIKSKKASSASRNPLRKLFNEERVNSSWSSSDFDDLESIPRETYCVWVPKADQASSDRCKKSSSTGTSMRWKLRDLIRRSNSDGKDSIVFLARSTSCPKSKKRDEEAQRVKVSKERRSGNGNVKVAGKVTAKGGSGNAVVSAHESLYVRNRTSKEMARRQSYLPYRRDIIGFFANVNGLGKHLRPF